MKEIDANKLMHLTAKIIGFAEAMVCLLETRDGQKLNKKSVKQLDDNIKEFNEITGSKLQTYTEFMDFVKSMIAAKSKAD